MDSGWRFHLDDFSTASPVNGEPVSKWRWEPAQVSGVPSAKIEAPGATGTAAVWKDVRVPSGDVFGGKNGFVWYQTTLGARPDCKHGESWTLRFDDVDDNGTVYLNGRQIFSHDGFGEKFDVPLEGPAWKKGSENIISVLVENTGGAGGILGPVTVWAAPKSWSLIPEPAKESFADGDWQTVHLPHDYVVAGTFDPKANASWGSLPNPQAWYRRTFKIPADWKGKSVWVDFDGIFSDSKIWFNGHYLGGERGGYMGARYDLAKYARYGGTNTIAVHVDPSKHEGWWYEGGGIYRHAWLNVADPMHVAPWSTVVKTSVHGLASGGGPVSADLNIQTTIVNDSASDRAFVIDAQIVGPDGKTVAKISSPSRTAPHRGCATVKLSVALPNASLWSLETPNMYRLVTTVRSGERTVDEETTPFGMRTIRFDANLGFFLNEKPVKLKGTCNHQDAAGIGIAMPDREFDWRIKKLKESGCNAIRTSHNPLAPEMLDACDRLGLLVMAETRHFGDTYSQKSSIMTPATDLSDLAGMIRRDRNHPSIILWSIANEEVAVERTPDGDRIARAMKNRIESLDNTRPVTAAIIQHFTGVPGLSGVVDVEGFNYGGPQSYDKYHQLHPAQPMLASETASAISTRGIYTMDRFEMGEKRSYLGDKARGYINGYGLRADGVHTAEVFWAPVAERPSVAGAFVWTGFDYRGEPSPFGWPVINSHFGYMDTCGFPKDDYYYYLAWWGSKPVVHLAPHWNWPADKREIKVMCEGNTERVELFLNGRSLGSKPTPRYGHLEWQVAYEPGALEARGYNGTDVAATDRVETTGPAAALKLVSDRQDLLADSEDQIPVEVAVLDSKGRTVPTADDEVEFTVTGPGSIAGVGNGDPSSHEPDKGARRKAFNGRCMVIVQATGEPGEITLHATAKDLAPATITVHSAPDPKLREAP